MRNKIFELTMPQLPSNKLERIEIVRKVVIQQKIFQVLNRLVNERKFARIFIFEHFKNNVSDLRSSTQMEIISFLFVQRKRIKYFLFKRNVIVDKVMLILYFLVVVVVQYICEDV